MSKRKTVRVKIAMEFDLHADGDGAELGIAWLEMVPLMMFSALRQTPFALGAEGDPTFHYLGGGRHETEHVDREPRAMRPTTFKRKRKRAGAPPEGGAS